MHSLAGPLKAEARAAIAAALVLLVAAGSVPAFGSDIALSGAEGHPRSRFPLAVYAPSTGEPPLDVATDRALADWNAVARTALGVDAFARVPREADAQIVIGFPASDARGLMGVTFISSTDGVVDLPVRIQVVAPQARGGTSRDTVFYQVFAHELGHALGLPHVRDPRSLMCCLAGSVDFNDPATRQTYVAARRSPDVGSVRPQLATHYERFWRQRP